jgi:hypothetical protein
VVVVPTSSDFLWFKERFPGFAEAFCLTFVENLTPAEVLRRIAAAPDGQLAGLDALERRTWETWDEHNGDRLLIGATAVGSWTLAVEVNGYLGATEELLIPLSRDTTVVSNYRNVNAVMSFYWLGGETVRLNFDPLFAFDRTGTDYDSLVDVMQQVGFDLRSGEDRSIYHVTEAALALSEYLTGIHFTPDMLETSTFVCGIADAPAG